MWKNPLCAIDNLINKYDFIINEIELTSDLTFYYISCESELFSTS